jgi:hypothetical protein
VSLNDALAEYYRSDLRASTAQLSNQASPMAGLWSLVGLTGVQDDLLQHRLGPLLTVAAHQGLDLAVQRPDLVSVLRISKDNSVRRRTCWPRASPYGR